MKETVLRFVARTGLAYEPGEELLAWGRALQPYEACPTLFRYPGPCGLRAALEGRPSTLGSPESRVVWLSDGPAPPQAPSAARFGTLALLQPLRLGPVLSPEPGVYVARQGWDVDVVWVPPAALPAPIAWDALETRAQALDALPGWESAREGVLADLDRYEEELRLLHGAGGAHPRVKWAEVAPATRRDVLASLGVPPVWSAAA